MTTVIIILTAIVFIGGIATVFKSGKEEGICKYTNVGEDD